jgi:cyclase
MKTIFTVVMMASLLVTGISAHADDSHFAKEQDVQVKVTKVIGNVYMLQGRGGNIGAIVGTDGILIIDDDYKVVSEKLREALKTLGSDTPKYIFNTHWHGDHTEGNASFAGRSIIVAHENVRKRLMDPPVIFGEKTAPYTTLALPVITYTESMSIHFDGDEVRAVHYPNGHTDGDTVVFFKSANVVHLGDHFFAGRFPFIDLDSGGSVQGFLNNVASLVKTIPADAKLIPGHGPLSSRDDLASFHSMLSESVKIVQDAMKQGKSLDEIKKAGFPDKFKEYSSGFMKPDQWIETIHRSYSMK